MLRLQRQFALEDVLPSKGADGAAYVVGQEGRKLLLAQDALGGDGVARTHIFSYDSADDKLVKLYSHSSTCKCVGASLDSQEGIIAVTTEELRVKDGEQQTYFKTSLAEILPAGESYRLNVRSQLVQRVQFISSGKSATLFLFIIEGMFVRLYQMHWRKRLGGGVKITAQPALISEVARKMQWCQWCGRTQRLYVAHAGVLRAYTFPKREKLLFEIPLPDAPLFAAVPRSYLGFRHHRFDGRAALISRQRMRLVALGDQGLVLCVQGDPVPAPFMPSVFFGSNPSSSNLSGSASNNNNVSGATPTASGVPASARRMVIPITLYVLHHNMRLSVDLPLAPGAPETSPAVFVALGARMLLCWIPGSVCVFVDCGVGRAPTASIAVSGAPFASPTPAPAVSWMADLDLRNIIGSNASLTSSSTGSGGVQASSGGKEGNALSSVCSLFHGNTGVVYTCELDRAALLDLFEVNNERLHLQAMQAAVVHMQDTELYTQLLMHALSRSGGIAASTELLTEFYVATLHLRLLAAEPHLPPNVVALLPDTTLPPVLTDVPNTSNPLFLKPAFLTGYTVANVKGELVFTSTEDLSEGAGGAGAVVAASAVLNNTSTNNLNNLNNAANNSSGGSNSGPSSANAGSSSLPTAASGVGGSSNSGSGSNSNNSSVASPGPNGGSSSAGAGASIFSSDFVITEPSTSSENLNASASALAAAASIMRSSPARISLANISSPVSTSSTNLLGVSPAVSAAEPQPSGMSRLVQLLFGREDSDPVAVAGVPEGEGPDGPELVSVCRSWGAAYEESLADLLYRGLGEREPRNKCLRYARMIRRCECEQVGVLYKCICDAAGLLNDEAATFQLLQNFYCFLELYSLPLPSGFASWFATLGFRCLPSALLVQYIDRNVFTLSDAFILNILPQCTDARLRLLLLMRMRDVASLVRALWRDPENCELVAPYLVSQIGIALPEGNQIEVLEEAEQSFFIPLSVFRAHVRMRSPSGNTEEDNMILEHVYKTACEGIKKALA